MRSKEEPGWGLQDHKDWTVEDWSKVTFSDESRFQLCPTPGLMVIWRPGQAYKPTIVKFGGESVMIWKNLLSTAPTMFPNSEDCFFQQDNAPCHTARSVKVWREDHQFKTLSWSAQSPDLNPIENLWNVIKRKMDGHKPSSKAELLEFLCQERHKFTQQ